MPHLVPALAQWQHALALKPALVTQDDAVRAALARATPHGHFADWLGIVAALPSPQAQQIEAPHNGVGRAENRRGGFDAPF